MAGSFAHTFSIHFGHEYSTIRMKLSSLLGSAFKILSKSATTHDNRVYLLNVRADTQDLSKGNQITSFYGKSGIQSASSLKLF
jgi:hypothetical protein